MIGALVVSHGHLAQELVAAAEMIVGEISHIQAVSIGWHDDVNDARMEIERRLDEVNEGTGVLIFTDMFGGTATNLAMTFLDSGQIEIVTGVNLPMIIKLASQKQEETLDVLALKVRDQGQKNIYLASEVLTPKG